MLSLRSCRIKGDTPPGTPATEFSSWDDSWLPSPHHEALSTSRSRAQSPPPVPVLRRNRASSGDTPPGTPFTLSTPVSKEATTSNTIANRQPQGLCGRPVPVYSQMPAPVHSQMLPKVQTRLLRAHSGLLLPRSTLLYQHILIALTHFSLHRHSHSASSHFLCCIDHLAASTHWALASALASYIRHTICITPPLMCPRNNLSELVTQHQITLLNHASSLNLARHDPGDTPPGTPELIIEGCYPDHDILQSPASDTPPGMRLTTDSSWNDDWLKSPAKEVMSCDDSWLHPVQSMQDCEKVLAQDYPHDGASQDRVSRALKSAAFLLEVPI